mmetsp:Transcript_24453/g.61133  ORF Transcript_24453/g.61133 Transcript_24453/m.61133 type:complete len:237 (+) Transcript_24453:1415-2125(+)
MHGLHLLPIQLVLLVCELFLELLQHVDNASRLELVAVGLRSLVEQLLVGHLLNSRLCLLQEGDERLLGHKRHKLEVLDLEQGLCLVHLVGLLLQDHQGLVQGSERLRVVGGSSLVVQGLLCPHVRSRLGVLLPTPDVFLELLDAVGQRLDEGRILLDPSPQPFDLRSACIDLVSLDPLLVLAPLVKGRKAVSLRLLLLDALGVHPIEELDDLRDRSSCSDGVHLRGQGCPVGEGAS